MNASEVHDRILAMREIEDPEVLGKAMDLIDEYLVPRFRNPQPSDDGQWCYLEELPSDAPPTLVQSYRPMKYCDESRAYEPDFDSTKWRFWTVAGWRVLTKGVWPCERPEGGGT